MKKIFRIKHLDCVNCALKIEQSYQRLEGVKNARVDFVREKVFIEGDIKDYTDKDLQTIARKFESNIIITDNNVSKHITLNKYKKLEISVNILGIFMFILVILFDFILKVSISETLRVTLYLTAYICIGGKVIITAFKRMFFKQFFDEHFLMTIATIGAFAIQDYLEAVAVMLFYRIGEYLQDLALVRSKQSIKDLMDIKPTIAHVLKDETWMDVNPESLEVGQIIRVKPGEKIPIDGIIIEGNSSIDASSLTGESMPKDVKKDSEVLSGSINTYAPLTIRVLKAYEDSTVALIIDFVENNNNKKAETEKFITKFAKFYTPIVVISALILAFFVPFLMSQIIGSSYLDVFPIYFRRALIFLVISCPCALVLSIPLSFFAGIGASSRQGILFKSGSDLEMMQHIEHYVFDKTGTLTKGYFTVHKIVSDDQDLLLTYAAHAESQSNHPIAKSILSLYNQDLIYDVIAVKEMFGQGIMATCNNQEVIVGNDKFMKFHQIRHDEVFEVGTIIHVAVNKRYLGYMIIKDEIKEDALILIQTLLEQGREVSMVTGDQSSVAIDVGAKLGIKNVHANCLPDDKVRIVKELVQKNKVAFVGDGINDAPVLMSASMGIAMGGIGSDAAIEASDVVMMHDDPSHILIAQKISKKTMRVIIENIILALGVKAIVLILGALGYAQLWLAIFADVGVSILAVFNAMRIFKK